MIKDNTNSQKSINKVNNGSQIVKNIEKRKIQIPELWNFIMKRKEKETSCQTHMWFGMDLDKIMFKVDDEDYDEFVNLVAKSTKEYIKNDNIESLHLLERPLKTGVLCFDLDIKFHKINTHSKYIRHYNS